MAAIQVGEAGQVLAVEPQQVEDHLMALSDSGL
jgi:hypothetical protein